MIMFLKDVCSNSYSAIIEVRLEETTAAYLKELKAKQHQEISVKGQLLQIDQWDVLPVTNRSVFPMCFLLREMKRCVNRRKECRLTDTKWRTGSEVKAANTRTNHSTSVWIEQAVCLTLWKRRDHTVTEQITKDLLKHLLWISYFYRKTKNKEQSLSLTSQTFLLWAWGGGGWSVSPVSHFLLRGSHVWKVIFLDPSHTTYS